MDTVAYVGAGYDARPVGVLPNVRHFVFIDSLPQTESPGILPPSQAVPYLFAQTPTHWFTLVINRFVEYNFTPDAGYVSPLDLDTPTRITFRNGERTVNYWFNTPWPSDNPALLVELSACNHLYLAGHDPHGSILNALSRGPFEINTEHMTVYTPNDDNETSTFYRLHFDTRIMRRVTNVWHYSMSGATQRFSSLREITGL